MSNVIDEINELEKAILTVSDNIAEIDLQLEVNEIHADGDDNYFDWIKKAKTAKFYKVKRLHKLTLDLKILNRAAHGNVPKKQKSGGEVMHQAMVKAHITAKENKEIEKTKRHKISEDINLKVYQVFKDEVSNLIGKDEYIKLIDKCRTIVEEKSNG